LGNGERTIEDAGVRNTVFLHIWCSFKKITKLD